MSNDPKWRIHHRIHPSYQKRVAVIENESWKQRQAISFDPVYL